MKHMRCKTITWSQWNILDAIKNLAEKIVESDTQQH